MTSRLRVSLLVSIAMLCLGTAATAQAQPANMSFFVTSAGPGKGADLGGLAGADKTCQTLAQAAGAGSKTWHAYLSTQGPGAVNARDRIGSGPWQNAKGAVVAKDVAELHGKNNLTKDTALTEKGETVNGRGDTPNMHDILTGSQPDGTAFAAGDDRTCGNWTKSGRSEEHTSELQSRPHLVCRLLLEKKKKQQTASKGLCWHSDIQFVNTKAVRSERRSGEWSWDR